MLAYYFLVSATFLWSSMELSARAVISQALPQHGSSASACAEDGLDPGLTALRPQEDAEPGLSCQGQLQSLSSLLSVVPEHSPCRGGAGGWGSGGGLKGVQDRI